MMGRRERGGRRFDRCARACRTSDMQGSPEPRRRSAAPSASCPLGTTDPLPRKNLLVESNRKSAAADENQASRSTNDPKFLSRQPPNPRIDLVLSLRRVVDAASETVLEGGSVDLSRLVNAVETLIRLLPGRAELPAPASSRPDPRQAIRSRHRADLPSPSPSITCSACAVGSWPSFCNGRATR
jgi:hypothetical protein